MGVTYTSVRMGRESAPNHPHAQPHRDDGSGRPTSPPASSKMCTRSLSPKGSRKENSGRQLASRSNRRTDTGEASPAGAASGATETSTGPYGPAKAADSAAVLSSG